MKYSKALAGKDDFPVWHSLLFLFAGVCKAHPASAEFPDHRAVKIVENEIRKWDDLPPG